MTTSIFGIAAWISVTNAWQQRETQRLGELEVAAERADATAFSQIQSSRFDAAVVSLEQALELLEFSPKKAAFVIRKLLESAIANAENNNGADIDELKVKTIYVDEGPTQKRFRARARGRGNRILKRSCHINIVVSDD